MTNNPGLKAAIRAYMLAAGVNYTTARRALLAGATPRRAASGGPTGVTSAWDEAIPSPDELVGGVLSGLLEDLLNEYLENHHLELPPGLPDIAYPYFHSVSPDDLSLEHDAVEDFDGDTLADAKMRAGVTLTGEMLSADARLAEAAGIVRRRHPKDPNPVVDVEVLQHFQVEVNAGVLYETVSERAELQEVFSYSWYDA